MFASGKIYSNPEEKPVLQDLGLNVLALLWVKWYRVVVHPIRLRPLSINPNNTATIVKPRLSQITCSGERV